MKSEFAALYELVLGRGVENSVLLERIKAEVLARYREKFPKGAIGAEVLVDTASGRVRLVTGEEDVTPEKFGEEAASVARQVLIEYMGERVEPKPKTKTKNFKIPGVLANIFFWGYNLYFGLFNLSMIWGYATAGWKTIWQMGLFRIAMWLVVAVTPLVAMAVAVKNKLYRTPGSLFKLFFLVELPLVVVAFVPLSLMSYTTPFVTLVTILALTIPGILYLYEKGDKMSDNWLKVRLFVEQFTAMMGGYLVLLFAFFAPIIIVGAAKALWPSWPVIRPLAYGSSIYPTPSPEPVIGSLLQMGLAALVVMIVIGLVLVPFALEWLLVKAFVKTAEKLPGYVAIFAAVILTIGVAAAYQPGGAKLIAALTQVATAPTFEDREKLALTILANEERAKQAVLDSQYSYSRYLFTKDSNDLDSGYRYILNMDGGPAVVIQGAFLALAYPFVYQGDKDTGGTLANNYKYVFGHWPTENGVSPTPTPTQNNAVLLTYRKTSVSPAAAGLLATVTVEEEYDNTTYQQREVIYEFNLPIDAVITNLKLGPNLEFSGQIAPKGAAQRTYEQELNRRRDPALLEQTGPRQYRLRVFPIPAKNDFTTLVGKRQKVQYSYVAAATPQGYPLPEITKKTNVFTNAGSAMTYKETEKFAPATVNPCRGQSGQTELAVFPCMDDKTARQALAGARIAVFYDVSAENKDGKMLADIRNIPGADIYKYNDTVSAKGTAEMLDPVYFGTSDVWKALAHFQENYDLAVIVTSHNTPWPDANSFSFGRNTQVYIVHTAGIPPYNLQLTSRLWQSRGDVANSVSEALENFARQKNLGPTPSFATDKSALTQYQNKAFLRSYVWSYDTDVTGDVTAMDKLNDYAVQANIVTPYSSLLALVNEQQENLLEQFKKGYNRYQDQPVTGDTTWQPIQLGMPMRSGISNPIFGTDLLEFNISPSVTTFGGGGGGEFGVLSAPFESSLSSSGLGLFVIANLVLLAGGLGFYLVRLLRKRG